MDKYLEIIGLLSQILGAIGLIISLVSFMLIGKNYNLGIALLALLIGFSFSVLMFTIKPILLGTIRIEANTRKLVTLASQETYASSELEEPYTPKHEKRNKNNNNFFKNIFSNKIFWLIIVDVMVVIILVYLFFLA